MNIFHNIVIVLISKRPTQQFSVSTLRPLNGLKMSASFNCSWFTLSLWICPFKAFISLYVFFYKGLRTLTDLFQYLLIFFRFSLQRNTISLDA